jgi:hypothetical protein
MNNVVIGDGGFNTDFFEKLDPAELLGFKPLGEDATVRTRPQRGLSGPADSNSLAAADRRRDERRAATCVGRGH